MTAIAAPYRSAPIAIKPDWIDYNGHLNVGYYHVLFDMGIDGFFDSIGLGERYRAERGMTTYTAESHARYLREVPPQASVVVATRILALDAKRFHLFQELRHAEADWLAATLESVGLSIDQRGEAPKVAPFPAETLEDLRAVEAAHTALPRPEGLGRTIGLSR